MCLSNIAKNPINESAEHEIIGIQPGEKHTRNDKRYRFYYTYEYNDYYKKSAAISLV